MTLQEFPAVDFAANPYKFIVAKVTVNEEEKVVVRAATAEEAEFHNDVALRLRRELNQAGLGVADVEVLGGGAVIEAGDGMFLTGSSTQYGVEPDRGATVRLVQERFPERPVSVK